MIIAIASGKGGTGKTTVAVNLALASRESIRLLDCDVEEPNSGIFISADAMESEPVNVLVPNIDENLCDGCRACSDFCEYNALAVMLKKPLVFAELCHSCGGCVKICPTKAITEIDRSIGVIESCTKDKITLHQGRLDVGNTMSPPVIRQVKKYLHNESINIVDCPPGTSCPMITAVKGSDFVLLVTEPTPFGLNDLDLAVQTIQKLNIPAGVVINRADENNSEVREYCSRIDIPILAELPDDRRIAEAYSKGESIVESLPEYRHVFENLLMEIQDQHRKRSA